MPPTFLDTVFVITLINVRDQYHHRATELSAEYDGRPLLTTDAVLVEIGNALARRFKPEAVEVLDYLLAAPDVTVVPLTPATFAAGLDLYRSHADKEWGLTDCLSFVVMRAEGIGEALTFDQHFAQAGFVPLMR